MPLDTQGDALQTYRGFVGEELTKSHSYEKWLLKRGFTQTAITAESSDTNILTYTTEQASNGVWSGEVQLVSEGEANLILTLTAGGRVKKTVFKYIVRDAKGV